jgi:hypothetical protein
MAKPDFNDKSWDATGWSLWGLIYTGAKSDTALKTAISLAFDQTREALGKLGHQVEPLASRVQEWRDELKQYARTISYGEADGVLTALKLLLDEVSDQGEIDRLLAEAKKKAPEVEPEPDDAPVEPVVKAKKKAKATPEAQAVDQQATKDGLGHGKSTAVRRPKEVKPKSSYTPPTPQQIWVQKQRDMATDCDNGIAFGNHDVDQESVLRRLQLDADDGGVKQYRSGPENSHKRIMKTRKGCQFWTLGLTHKEKRDKGQFSVYERDGGSNRFTHVSGVKHPAHP